MFMYPSYSAIPDYDKWTSIYEKLQNSKTHDAYLKLINSEVDLIVVATEPSEDELAQATRAGVELELIPIALDGFIFMVNRTNSVANLTTSEVVDIYTGKITNWKEVGGRDVAIEPYTRQRNSGSQELMDKLVMKDREMKEFPEEVSLTTMMQLIDGVDQNKNSIGYSLYYYKNTMVDRAQEFPLVKVLSLDGVEPSPESISSREYPHVFYIYAVTRKDQDPHSLPYRIKMWLLSTEGQNLVSEAGYSPLR